MNRRTMLAATPLLLIPSLLPAPGRAQSARVQPAPLTPQDQADLNRIQAYLNGITTLKARFIQAAPDGSTSSGIAWMERPGRMRFQYNPPSPVLLVAGHGLFVFYDRQLEQTTNIPLGSTPLGLLLSPDIHLTGDVTVTAFARPPGQLQVTLVRTSSPGDGSLTLAFTDDPLQLRQWTVVDSQRRETQVTLYDVTTGGTFDPGMFVFINPKFMPGSDKLYKW
jgi:outer membrane lipoprotein-sorting protein